MYVKATCAGQNTQMLRRSWSGKKVFSTVFSRTRAGSESSRLILEALLAYGPSSRIRSNFPRDIWCPAGKTFKRLFSGGKTMMQSVHKLNRSRSLRNVVVVGCGGTGSALIGGLPFLHQALLAAGQPGLQVIVADGDKVSTTNCVRQPFSESEIGLYKSVVLVNRINLFWG